MKIKYQDRVDEYVLHRMSYKERKVFEQDVDCDEELNDQLSFTKDVQQVLKSRNEKLAKMNKWQKEDIREGYDIDMAEFRSGRSIIYWLSGIAVVFVIGFFAFQKFNMTEQLSSDVPYVNNSNITFSGNSTTFHDGSDYAELELLISQKKYKEALHQIDYMSLALKNDSIELTQDLMKNDEQKECVFIIIKEEQDNLKWLKVHTLLCLNQKDLALKVLNELRSTEGSYQLSADSLYQHIK